MDPVNDHDLLIRLDTKFEEFIKSHSMSFKDLNEKLLRVLNQIENKADRHDVVALMDRVEKIDERIVVLETDRMTEIAKKQTIINLGNIGAKGWAMITGAVLFILAVLQALKDL